MKKFSKITNQKVNEKPQAEIVISEQDMFKASVLNLMEKLLTIQTYGPVDRYLRAGSIKISGKELFVEALVDLMNDQSLKEKAKLLEGLKSKIKDWEALDKGIDEINSKLNESNKGKMLNHKNKLTSLLRIYKDDRETLLQKIEDQASKIKDGDKAFWRAVPAEQMASEGKFPKAVLKQIADKFYFRAKQLGHKR